MVKSLLLTLSGIILTSNAYAVGACPTLALKKVKNIGSSSLHSTVYSCIEGSPNNRFDMQVIEVRSKGDVLYKIKGLELNRIDKINSHAIFNKVFLGPNGSRATRMTRKSLSSRELMAEDILPQVGVRKLLSNDAVAYSKAMRETQCKSDFSVKGQQRRLHIVDSVDDGVVGIRRPYRPPGNQFFSQKMNRSKTPGSVVKVPAKPPSGPDLRPTVWEPQLDPSQLKHSDKAELVIIKNGSMKKIEIRYSDPQDTLSTFCVPK